MKRIYRISQIIISLVFTFSSIAKSIDPIGFSYKIEDYFIAFNTTFFASYSLYFAFAVCLVEFLIGFSLLLNIKPKITASIALIIMSFFTILTLNDAIFNPVPDCGCFGDAIKLSNWQTFFKNLILMPMVIFIFIYRKRIKELFNNIVNNTLLTIAALFIIGFMSYNYLNLPIIDFRNWKIGNKMTVENKIPIKYYLIYKNKITGEEKEFLSPNYPYNDTAWLNQWSFVDQRIEDPNKNNLHDLLITNNNDEDVTENFIENHDYQFILICWDLNASNINVLKKCNDIYLNLDHNGYSFIALTSTIKDNVSEICDKYGLLYEFYYADDIVLKTIIRSNPGLLLMKNGYIINKWHYRNIPSYDEIQKLYPKE